MSRHRPQIPTSAPLDVRKKWLNIARRLQSVARSGGFSVLTIQVLVDAKGDPVCWLEPKQYKIEPAKLSREEIVRVLTGEQEKV